MWLAFNDWWEYFGNRGGNKTLKFWPVVHTEVSCNIFCIRPEEKLFKLFDESRRMMWKGTRNITKQLYLSFRKECACLFHITPRVLRCVWYIPSMHQSLCSCYISPWQLFHSLLHVQAIISPQKNNVSFLYFCYLYFEDGCVLGCSFM
jgi:hypothetical protein